MQKNNYDDIINLPHHQSKVRPQMSLYNRAAQFSPFSALTGYEDAIEETARLTENKHTLSDEETDMLNRKMALLKDKISEHPTISIRYFIPDELKDGGSYSTICGELRAIDSVNRLVILQDGTTVPFDDIEDISGDVFEQFDFDTIDII